MAKRIITISREFGSGGRFIGEEVAKKLGIAYYDKDIIGQIAEKSGFSPEYIQENAELSPKERLVWLCFCRTRPYRKIRGRYGIRSAEKGDSGDCGKGELRHYRKKCGFYFERQRGCAECIYTRQYAGKSSSASAGCTMSPKPKQ